MGYRTDIAAEAHENLGDIEGVVSKKRTREGISVTET